MLTVPASLEASEITDRGYVNQRAVRERRADRVALLVEEPLSSHVAWGQTITAP